MTDSMKFPKPQGLQLDRLDDAAWDLRDYNEAWIGLDQGDPQMWLYWLQRYQGFAEDEIELDGQNQWNFKIKMKD